MHDLYGILLTSLQHIWLYRLPALLTATIVCVGGWIYVYTLPDVYEARTLVYVDTESMLRPLLKGLAVDDTEMEMELVRVTRRSLLSRPNLRRMVRETDMDLQAQTKEQMERLLAGLAANVKVTAQSTKGRRGPENIVLVSYRNRDPRLANRVVESLLDIFVESLMGADRTDTDKSERFLDTKIAEYKEKLESSEKTLEEFKRTNAGMLPGEGRGYFSRTNDAKDGLRAARLEVREARNRRDQLKAQIIELERSRPAAAAETSAAHRSATQERLDELEIRLAELVLNYTDAHPDVISTRRTLDEVRSKLDAGRGLTLGVGGGGFDSRVLDELRVELGKAEAELAAVKVRVDAYEARLEELRRAVDIIPRVEADYVKLTRDYDVYKSQYDELVKRRESARMSREADLSADLSQFQVIEPPEVPLFPISPNRPRLVTVVLALGLGAGVGIGFLLSQLRPTFVSTKDLREAVELPVWGRVSTVRTARHARRERLQLTLYGLSLACLLAAYAYVLVIHALGINVVAQLKNLTGSLI